MEYTRSVLKRVIVLVNVSIFAAFAAHANDVPEPLRAAVEDAVNRVKPSLVRIHVVSTAYREGREFKFESSGSGVIITPEGHVVTNHHVAGHATRLVCTLSNREEIEATLVGTDPLSDIAVIKLNPDDGRTFPVVEFGDSSQVEVGDHVMAMGSPMALSQSVTLGIVSNTEMVMPRRMRFGRFELDGEDVGSLVRWIAHDAQIYGGNSGGPLVNLQGEIIGINEISVGLGGAIPGNLARDVAWELMERGDVSRSWLGVTIRPLLKHGDVEQGVLISDVISDTPAAEAGLQSGDVLVSIAGHDVMVRFEEEIPEFNRVVSELDVGKEYDAVVLRDGAEKSLKIKTAKREQVLPKQRELKQWGLTVRDLSFVLAKEKKRESQDGVLVTSVSPGGGAGEAKPVIQEDDILVDVGGTPIKRVADLERVTDDLTKDATEPVPVLTTFERKTGSYVTVVEVGIKELNDPGLEVKKAWLPVETQVITRDIAEQLGREDLTGFRITQVYGGSTAAEAGLNVGDLIVSVDGQKLVASAPEHYEELPTLIRNYRVGTEAELAIIRDDEDMSVAVELVRAPKLDREMKRYRDENFEFTVRDVTFFDRANERWKDDPKGVMVDEVKSGGWAALGLMNVGDLITQVDGKSVSDVSEMEEVMDQIEEDQPDAIVLQVRRGIYTVFLEIEPKWENA